MIDKAALLKARAERDASAERVARLRREYDIADRALREAKEQEEKAAVVVACARNNALIAVLTPDVIDALAPEHSRTSCDDNSLSNDEHGCARCVLLAAQRDGWIEATWAFTVESTR
jgi:homospermidine synthase